MAENGAKGNSISYIKIIFKYFKKVFRNNSWASKRVSSVCSDRGSTKSEENLNKLLPERKLSVKTATYLARHPYNELGLAIVSSKLWSMQIRET